MLESCEKIVEDGQRLQEVREMLLNKVLIDLEEEELHVKKELFDQTIRRLDKLPYTAFRSLEKDYLRLKHWLSKVGLTWQNADFEELRKKCERCLYYIKEHGALKDELAS